MLSRTRDHLCVSSHGDDFARGTTAVIALVLYRAGRTCAACMIGGRRAEGNGVRRIVEFGGSSEEILECAGQDALRMPPVFSRRMATVGCARRRGEFL